VFSTSLPENGVTLSSVLGKGAVNEVDEIVSDWDGENFWHGDGVGDSGISLVDGDNWSRGHFCKFKRLLNKNIKC
jgi:hypothetical protein